MKFKHIPQFTRSGSWECDFGLLEFVKRIDEMVKRDNLELNPDFQRGNVWSEDQQISYVEFLLKGGKTARVIYLNDKNWRTGKIPKKGEFVCVDGLQRITAIQRFVDNEIKVFGYYFNEYEDRTIFCRRLDFMKININDLQTREEVLQWYIDFNSGGTVHSQEEIDRVKKLLEEEKAKNR